jgi:hypothetical protein
MAATAGVATAGDDGNGDGDGDGDGDGEPFERRTNRSWWMV